MLVQRMPAHEAQYHGEALPLHAGPQTGNHSGGRFARTRLATHCPHAGDELAFSTLFPMSPLLDASACHKLLRSFLSEDIGGGDITTETVVSPTQRARGEVIAKAPLVLAG